MASQAARSYDVVVIGAGPAGEVVASRLPGLGLRTALIERELVGGECAYWACVPSKTLLRPAEVLSEAERAAGTSIPERRWQELVAYRDYMIRSLDDSKQVAEYREQGVDVYRGEGRIVAEQVVEVGGERLRAPRIILAPGSAPDIPALAAHRRARRRARGRAREPARDRDRRALPRRRGRVGDRRRHRRDALHARGHVPGANCLRRHRGGDRRRRLRRDPARRLLRSRG